MSYYHIQSGVQSTNSNVKKYVAGVAIGLLLVVGASVPTFAASSNASSCGAAHSAAANVNGNFGFLGEVGGTPGYHDGAVGQDVGATGYNNSHTSCHE